MYASQARDEFADELELLAQVERAYAVARREVFDVVAQQHEPGLTKRQHQVLVELEFLQRELDRVRAERRAGSQMLTVQS